MSHFFKNFLLFIPICLFQIYFEGGSFFVRPIIDFLLIFLIFSFFDLSLFYIVLLLLVRGFIFDTLSGLAWGTNLFSLFFSFGIGFFLTRLLESENFFSRIIIGESIINIYFLVLFLLNLFLSHSNLWLIILIDALINSVVYLILMILEQKIRTHGFKKKFD